MKPVLVSKKVLKQTYLAETCKVSLSRDVDVMEFVYSGIPTVTDFTTDVPDHPYLVQIENDGEHTRILLCTKDVDAVITKVRVQIGNGHLLLTGFYYDGLTLKYPRPERVSFFDSSTTLTAPFAPSELLLREGVYTVQDESGPASATFRFLNKATQRYAAGTRSEWVGDGAREVTVSTDGAHWTPVLKRGSDARGSFVVPAQCPYVYVHVAIPIGSRARLTRIELQSLSEC